MLVADVPNSRPKGFVSGNEAETAISSDTSLLKRPAASSAVFFDSPSYGPMVLNVGWNSEICWHLSTSTRTIA